MSPRATYIRIRNWDRYQHYSDRRPPWIKLHVELLDKHDTMSLPAATFKLAIVLLLDAARTSNVIPSNIDRLAADAYLTRDQTRRGLNELLALRFVEPLGKRRAQKELASNGLAEGYPSRARTRSASVSEGLSSEEQPQAHELVAHFCERVKANGDALPDRVRGQTAKEIKRLVLEGIEAKWIRRALELLADKGKHPSILSSLVLEAQRESNGRVDVAAIAREMWGEEVLH